MGIPRLTSHLHPYAENVFIGRDVEAVVIDGPSLVYHIDHRLRGWMDPNFDILDYQPSCDEISRGVVSFLLQLTRLGVKIHQICFDGALPTSKRKTRLSRIERTRRRLALARHQISLPATLKCRKAISTESGQVWCCRGLPRGRKGLPENPFMVSVVYEDLQYRWNTETIQKEISNDTSGLEDVEYPWAFITSMVSGEADTECASVAKRTGCAVLTDDSDLLLHDLGSSGAVLFLGSVQSPLPVWDPLESQIQGLKICPNALSPRLGIRSIQRFAYELTKEPHLRLSEAVRRANNADDNKSKPSPEYHEFLREYQPHANEGPVCRTRQPQLMDPRVSELFWQYELPNTYCVDDVPHVYLGVLNEDPSRRCAWEQGRVYRRLGYALFNTSRGNQFADLQEFVRRGERVVADPIVLAEVDIPSDMQLLRQRLNLARETFDSSAKSFWFLFALSEIYETSNTFPSGEELESFLVNGYMKGHTSWSDVHLLAQVQAVLYSLRMLQQLLNVAASKDYDLTLLLELPPLHIMMSRQSLNQSFANLQITRHMISQLLTTYATW